MQDNATLQTAQRRFGSYHADMASVWHIGAAAASVLAVAAATVQDESVTYIDGEAGKQIARFVQRAEAMGFSGSVLAARNGKVIAAVGVGHADLEMQQPNTPATLFEVASVTKQFTAAAVMRLVAEGKLNLDDSIAAHLPNVPEDCHSITVEHLLRHTSGIPGTNSQGGGDDIEAVLGPFLRGGPAHEPGTRWEYWNQGYALLTEIIKSASGAAYTEFCRDSLFEPAGMRVTRFTGDDPPEGALAAVGTSAYGPPRSALEHPYGSYGFQYRGMGGVVTNVWDFWRWDRALHGNDLLDAQAKSTLFQPGLNDYALGWFVRTDAAGRVVQSHGGAVRGFVCEVRRYPNEDALLVVLCNRDSAPLRQIVPALETILFGGDSAKGQPLQPLEEAVVAGLLGTYRDSRGNQLVIEHGPVLTNARILWSPPYGPVTRAMIGLNDDGELTLFDGTDMIAVQVERSGDEPASGLTILGQSFQREK